MKLRYVKAAQMSERYFVYGHRGSEVERWLGVVAKVAGTLTSSRRRWVNSFDYYTKYPTRKHAALALAP